MHVPYNNEEKKHKFKTKQRILSPPPLKKRKYMKIKFKDKFAIN